MNKQKKKQALKYFSKVFTDRWLRVNGIGREFFTTDAEEAFRMVKNNRLKMSIGVAILLTTLVLTAINVVITGETGESSSGFVVLLFSLFGTAILVNAIHTKIGDNVQRLSQDWGRRRHLVPKIFGPMSTGYGKPCERAQSMENHLNSLARAVKTAEAEGRKKDASSIRKEFSEVYDFAGELYLAVDPFGTFFEGEQPGRVHAVIPLTAK